MIWRSTLKVSNFQKVKQSSVETQNQLFEVAPKTKTICKYILNSELAPAHFPYIKYLISMKIDETYGKLRKNPDFHLKSLTSIPFGGPICSKFCSRTVFHLVACSTSIHSCAARANKASTVSRLSFWRFRKEGTHFRHFFLLRLKTALAWRNTSNPLHPSPFPSVSMI